MATEGRTCRYSCIACTCMYTPCKTTDNKVYNVIYRQIIIIYILIIILLCADECITHKDNSLPDSTSTCSITEGPVATRVLAESRSYNEIHLIY